MSRTYQITNQINKSSYYYENPYESEKKKTGARINRSTKLRKYASVYKSYVRKTEQSKTIKSPRRNRKINSKEKEQSITPTINYTSTNNIPKKALNAYQKFVQSESKKDKYKKLPGKERLSIIAEMWKKINK